MFLSSYRNTSASLVEREMLWEHKPQTSVFTSVSITRYTEKENMSSILLQSMVAKKGKHLVNFDYQYLTNHTHIFLGRFLNVV